jgi:error-prone DNA polymerase
VNPPPKPPRRRLRAPLEPGLSTPLETDPRSATHRQQRRGNSGTGRPCSDEAECVVATPRYAELHCLSNFSFQRGASSANELFRRARRLGYAALAITDECSMAGIVRARKAAEEHGVRLVVGCEVRFDDGLKLVLLARDHAGYSDLCRLITIGRRRSAKGEYRLVRDDAEILGDGVLALWMADASTGVTAKQDAAHRDTQAAWFVQRFPGRAWIAVELHREAGDAERLAALRELGGRHGLPLVASGDVHMHVRRRRALQDALTAIRLGRTVAEAGLALYPNGERHLRRVADLETLYPPELLQETLRVASLCTFDMSLNYRYPSEIVPSGLTPIEHLRTLTWEGAAQRWPAGISGEVRDQIERELALIQELAYEHFFLTVADIVEWARARKPPILCQGRGSSANSAVCYCLHITEIRPGESNLLFERFLSRERNEPPDIDVDFEHERREEVIQYVFGKYGRERAALAATVISYRGKSAVRDLGRALGVPDDRIDVLGGLFSRIRHGGSFDEILRERGLDPHSPVLQKLFRLTTELRGFPRHLSQHVGGFVISDTPLHHLVPVENAAMAQRTIIQWDKDDLEEMKLLKIDVLALGMLTAVRKCLDLLHGHGLWRGTCLEAFPSLRDIPPPSGEASRPVYDMICKADTIGVFQIESRAQMSMLPRLQPREYYDLVVQIAIVRPGPIQGDMVHPYLRRRKKLEDVTYPQSKAEREAGRAESAVKAVLERTLGVPIFQEQVMKLIQVVADFTPGEADGLRRAMAAWGRGGDLEPFREKIQRGMRKNGYDDDYFERIFEQIKGFGEYGFPESHAASFALLAYASSWLKCHYPAAFTCALLNSLPMGFYGPAQLIRDAQRHGVRVLPVDVTISQWDCTLEALERNAGSPQVHALRLGFSRISGFPATLAQRIVEVRNTQAFRDVADLVHRADLDAGARARLADADALRSLSGHRHQARWDSAGIDRPVAVLAAASVDEESIRLAAPSLHRDVMSDYASQGFSLRRHPLALVREALDARRMLRARDVLGSRNGRHVRCAGLVTVRQRPGTAKGVTFVTLEDETGILNVVVWSALASRQRRVLIESAVLGVEGELQCSEGVQHVIAHRLLNLDVLLPELGPQSRDFH